MTISPTSRRKLLRIAAAGAAAAGTIAASACTAAAHQDNMEHALGALNDALNSLREATHDKGGHRVTAMNLIRQAISEVQAGIDAG